MLTLEPQVAAHADALHAVLCDPALYRHEGAPPESIAWLRARLTRLESRLSPDGSQQWLNWIVRLDVGDVAGFVQATVHADGLAVVAYVLGSAYWGRGIATRAVRDMMQILQREHGARRFGAVLKASNTPSLRLLERLGFTPAAGDLLVQLAPGADELAMEIAADRP